MAITKPAVQIAAQNAERYWFTDGFVNICWSVYFFALAVMFYAGFPDYTSHQKSTERHLYWIGYFLLINAGFFHRPIVKWLKGRVTYPRTGYAAPPYREVPDTGFFAPPIPTQTELEAHMKQESAEFWRMALFLVLFAGLFWPNRWLCLPAGFLFGRYWLRIQPPERLSWLILASSTFIGILVMVLPIQDNRRLAVLILLFGVVFLSDGFFHLFSYLRRNPVTQAQK